MAIELRPLLHLFLFVVTFFAVLWAITSDQLSTCDVKNKTESPIKTPMIVFTYHSVKAESKVMDSLSRSSVTYIEVSYDGTNDIDVEYGIPAYPGTLPEYAKTSYISEILSAVFLFLFLVVYLQSQISIFSNFLGILSTICIVLSAIMATLVNSNADPNKLKFGGGGSGSGSGSESGDTSTFDSCILGMSSIMAWIAVGTWTILSLDLWRYHKNRNN